MKLRGILAGLGVLVLAGCSTGGEPEPAETFTMTGELDLGYDQGKYYSSELNCTGAGGYSDIQSGAPVTVYDNAGQIVALGALGPGRRNSAEHVCTFKFDVPNVPAGKGFYQYEISHRGKLTLTEAEAVAGLASASLNN